MNNIKLLENCCIWLMIYLNPNFLFLSYSKKRSFTSIHKMLIFFIMIIIIKFTKDWACFLFLDPQNEIGPSISSVVLYSFVLSVYIVTLILVTYLCPSSVRVVTTFTGTVFLILCNLICGPGSSVGIATDYGLDGPGIESRWGRDFPPIQTGPGAHPASCTMGTRSFPGVKFGQGVLLTTHPLLAPRSWKSRAIPLPSSGPPPGL